MAVIGKIRKQSGLLLVVIGVALLAFVLGDFAKGNKRPAVNIGTINGENLSIQDFNRKFEENVSATKQQRKVERLDQDELFRLRETTYMQMVQQTVMAKEYASLGLVVTSEELFDQVQGPNPHQAILSNFQNQETGMYDRNLVINYLQNLDKMQQASKDQWILFERYIKEDRLNTKYQNLITKSYHLPKPLAKLMYHEKNDKASVDFVGVRFVTLADSLVKLSDNDYRAFYDVHKKNYEREATRDLEYVVFEITPSEEDQMQAQKAAADLVNEFRLTPNVAGFVNANSESRYDSTWLSRQEIPVSIEKIIPDQEVGFVYGPYFENNAYKVVKLVDVTLRPDSLKANHILFAYEGAMRSEQKRSKDAAKKLADSLLTEIKKRPAKLTELAVTLSDDQSAASNKGDLGWFKDGQMVPAFNQFVLSNKVGAIGVVETDFGFHIVEVTGKKEPQKKFRLATITQNVTASTKTYQNNFAKASKFATENTTQAKFNLTVENEGLNKRLAPSLGAMTNSIPGIQNPRQIIRWAFDKNTEEGQVSTIFDMDNLFVVAVLTKKVEKGVPELKEIKDVIQPLVLNKKKGEMLLEKIKPIASDMRTVATTYNAEIQQANDLTFDTRSLTGFGQETKAIAAIMTMKEGETKAFAGSSAVFVAKINSIMKAAEATQLDQVISENKMSFESNVRNNGVFRALEKVSKIEDNRLLFY